MTGKRTNKFSPEVRAGAVRLVLDHEWADECDVTVREEMTIPEMQPAP